MSQIIQPPALFLPYQRRWLQDKSRFKIACWSRQIGKSFTTSWEPADDCVAAELGGGKARWVILSRGERQSREVVEEGLMLHLKAYQKAVKFKLSERSYVEDDAGLKINRTALEVSFDGGSRITALPANPDTARGFSASVMLDEFAFHKDSRKIWQALFPVISAGHKLRITSTPNGKNNKFYDLMTGTDDKWSRHRVTIHDAVAQGLPRDIAELKEALDDEDAWQQEFELEWLDEASAWLSYDLINTVEHDHAGVAAHYTGGPCFVGVDIGLRRDLFVVWVYELVGDVLWTREIVARRRIQFGEMEAEINRVMAEYNVVRACMDQTGLGEQIVERMQTAHGTMRVEGVLFTAPSKLVMANNGKQCFEDRRLRIPLGDTALRTDLHKLKRETSASGTPRFVAERDSAGHADRAWACFLGIHAAGKPQLRVTSASALPRERETFDDYLNA